MQFVYMLSKVLRSIKSFLRPLTSTVWLFVFNLLAPFQNASANPAFQLKEITLPGIVSPHFVPAGNGFFTTINNPQTEEAAVVYVDSTGRIIKSIPILYLERGGDPSRNGVAAIEVNQDTFYVFGANATIYIKGPGGEDIIAPKAFDLKGIIWTTPILSAIKDKEFYIIVTTDRDYQEGGQSQHDTYVYTFIYNVETKTLDFASVNQPIFQIDKAFIGRNDPALCGDELFFTIGYCNIFYSEIYAIDLKTGEVKGGWPQPLGSTMTTGPAAVGEADNSLVEVAAGTFEYISVDTNKIGHRKFVFFKSDGTQPWKAFLKPGDVSSAPEYTKVNGDRYPEVLFTITSGSDVTLYILDGKTKELIDQRYLGKYPVQQFIIVDLNADGLIEIIYRTRTDKIVDDQLYIENKVVVLHLDKEGHIVDSETEELLLKPNLPYRPQGPLSVLKIHDQWTMIVGGKYTVYIDQTQGPQGRVMTSDTLYLASGPYKPEYPLPIAGIDAKQLVPASGAQGTAAMNSADYETRSDIYLFEIVVPVEIEYAWPVAVGRNLRNTACYLIVPEKPVPPEQLTLYQNYPNPFDYETIIKFALPEQTYVKVTIFNILGEKVRTLLEDNLDEGKYTIVWDGRNDKGKKVASGIYFYRISTSQPKQIGTKKMILLNAIFMFMPLFGQ